MNESLIKEIWQLMEDCADIEHLVAQAMIHHDVIWANNLMEELHAQLRLDELVKEEWYARRKSKQ